LELGIETYFLLKGRKIKMANPKKAYDRIYAYYIKKGYTHEEADHVAKNIANKQDEKT
tara:strand:+ start:314 stop:487 length:174 start_codon:yes stop_codon:yes gene_type:complete